MISYASRALRIAREKKRFIIGTGILLALFFFFSRGAPPQQTPQQEPPTQAPITTATPRELVAQQQPPITFVGEVRSESQAELRSEASGEVRGVYVTAGATVQAGTMLVEIENATEQAGLAQAQAVLSSAEATLAKVRSGAREEDRDSVATEAQRAANSLLAAKTQAENSYTQALALAENALFAQADIFFNNPLSARPTFTLRSANIDEKKFIETERFSLGKNIDAWREVNASPSTIDEQLLQDAQEITERIQTFLNTIANFVSEQTTDMADAATRASQEQTIITARNNISTARSTLISAKESLSNARAVSTTANLQEERTETGERSEDIATAEASVAQARAGVSAAQATLERTRIRTPIAGTITTLNVNVGDFVNNQESIAVVAGNSDTLQIESFVSGAVLDQLNTESTVRILGTSATGTIVSISPGLDPTTKQARVLIAMSDTANLTRGSFVTLHASTPVRDIETPDMLPIPLTALKVEPHGIQLYTLDDTNTIVGITIPEGPLVGSVMLIPFTSIPEDTRILVDARAYQAGDTITIQ
jgi:multidrug efflux pump subunit AcrA (membrane-fusion protein)